MPELKEVIPWLLTLGIFLIGFYSNKAIQGKQDGREIESIKGDITYIKKSVDELKMEKRDSNKTFMELQLEVTKMQTTIGNHDQDIADLKNKLEVLQEKGGCKNGQ